MPTPPVQYLSLMMFHKARCMPLLSLVVFNIHQDAIDSFCASAGWRSVPPMPNLAGTTYCRIHQQSRCLPECDCHQLQTLILVENSADSADSILYSLRAPSWNCFSVAKMVNNGATWLVCGCTFKKSPILKKLLMSCINLGMACTPPGSSTTHSNPSRQEALRSASRNGLRSWMKVNQRSEDKILHSKVKIAKDPLLCRLNDKKLI